MSDKPDKKRPARSKRERKDPVEQVFRNLLKIRWPCAPDEEVPSVPTSVLEALLEADRNTKH
jgi:hypothetical protein